MENNAPFGAIRNLQGDCMSVTLEAYLLAFCQIFECRMENLAELLNFNICHISFLSFNSGNHIFIHITADELKLVSKIALRKIVAVAKFDKFFANEVLFARIREWFWQITSLPILSHFLHFLSKYTCKHGQIRL